MINRYKPTFYKLHEAISLSSMEKVLKTLISLLSKRGVKLVGKYDVWDTVKKGSGIYYGFKFYIGGNGKALRFNWSKDSSSTLSSIDIFNKYSPLPFQTLFVDDLNLIQVVEALTQYLNGERDIAVSESYKEDSKLGSIFGKKKVEVKKAEPEQPIVKSSTEAEVKKVVFRGLTSEEIFKRIGSGVERILDPNSGDNLLIVAGDPGVGKTIEVENALKAGASGPVIPKMLSIPLNDISKKPSEEDEKTLQDKLNQIAAWAPDFKKVYVQGSSNVTAEQLFIELFKANGRILFYDDSDSVITDKKCIGLLKLALQSKQKRLLTWGAKTPYLTVSKEVGAIPKTFTYTGKIIVVTNKPLDKIDSALRSRSGGLAIEVDLNSKQLLNRLKSIIPAIQKAETPMIPVSIYYEVWDWLYDLVINKKVLKKFDFRTFVKGLVVERYRTPDFSTWEAIAANILVTKYPNANIVIDFSDE